MNSKNTLHFSANLKWLFEKHGLSQRIVEKKTMVPQSTISGFLNGAEPKGVKHAKAIANYFSISLDELLFENLAHLNREEFQHQDPLRNHKYEVVGEIRIVSVPD